MTRRILTYALPMFANQALLFAGSTAALIRLGRLGTDTLGAIAAPQALFALAVALFAGFVSGVTISAARARAANDRAHVERILAHALGVAVVSGVVLGSFGAFFAPDILHALSASPAVMNVAVPYTQLLSLYLPAAFVYAIYSAVLLGLDDLRTPIVMLAADTAVFLALLAILHLGALSVPIAALAATLSVTIVAAVRLGLRRQEFRFDVPLHAFVPRMRLIHETLRFDAPPGIQCAAVALADVALVSIANGYGPRGGATFVLVMQIVGYLAAPATIFASAASAFAAHGDAPQRAARSALLCNLAVSGTIAVAAYALATPLLRLFVGDAQTIDAARAGVYVVAWSVFALGAANVICGELDAYGQTIWPVSAAVAGVWIVLVPCAFLFSARMGLDGMWDAFALAYAGIAVVQISAAPVLRLRRVREHVPAATDRALQ